MLIHSFAFGPLGGINCDSDVSTNSSFYAICRGVSMFTTILSGLNVVVDNVAYGFAETDVFQLCCEFVDVLYDSVFGSFPISLDMLIPEPATSLNPGTCVSQPMPITCHARHARDRIGSDRVQPPPTTACGSGSVHLWDLLYSGPRQFRRVGCVSGPHQ